MKNGVKNIQTTGYNGARTVNKSIQIIDGCYLFFYFLIFRYDRLEFHRRLWTEIEIPKSPSRYVSRVEKSSKKSLLHLTWLFDGRPRKDKQLLTDGLNWLCYLAGTLFNIYRHVIDKKDVIGVNRYTVV